MAFWHPSGYVNGDIYCILFQCIDTDMEEKIFAIYFGVFCEQRSLGFREVKPYKQDDMRTSHR